MQKSKSLKKLAMPMISAIVIVIMWTGMGHGVVTAFASHANLTLKRNHAKIHMSAKLNQTCYTPLLTKKG